MRRRDEAHRKSSLTMKAIKQSSKMAKAKRLENKVASLWRSKMGDLAVRTPGSGSGKFKGDVYNRYYSVECKNQEKIKLWEWWNQARSQKILGKPPLLVISGNFRPILAILDIDNFLDLLKEAKIDKHLKLLKEK